MEKELLKLDLMASELKPGWQYAEMIHIEADPEVIQRRSGIFPMLRLAVREYCSFGEGNGFYNNHRQRFGPEDIGKIPADILKKYGIVSVSVEGTDTEVIGLYDNLCFDDSVWDNGMGPILSKDALRKELKAGIPIKDIYCKTFLNKHTTVKASFFRYSMYDDFVIYIPDVSGFGFNVYKPVPKDRIEEFLKYCYTAKDFIRIAESREGAEELFEKVKDELPENLAYGLQDKGEEKKVYLYECCCGNTFADISSRACCPQCHRPWSLNKDKMTRQEIGQKARIFEERK